jgi:hypothetical protein
MSQKSVRRRVLGGAQIAARPGRRVQCYDSDATPCGCTVALFFGIPAVPVEVERERRPGDRRCLVCGTIWRVGEDLWTPLPGAVPT